jgi:alpha-beta hydrolase superfamily lysophospholipase
MHGTEDHLTDFSASVEFSEKLMSQRMFRAWEGLYHELHNENEKRIILDFVKEWLDDMICGYAMPPGR